MYPPGTIHDAAHPFTWTPTQGNNIPPHAVPVYEGPHGPLYIARGLLEGELQIGTTSHLSREGAWLQNRYGRCHAAFEYEVLTLPSSVRFQLEPALPSTLVAETGETTPQGPTPRDIVPTTRGIPEPSPWMGFMRGQPVPIPKEREERRLPSDPPPYSSPRGGWIEVPKQAHPPTLSERESVQFKRLARSKLFALIDDTPSMQRSWSQTRAALAGTVDILSSDNEWEGVNVRFLNRADGHWCVKTREEFERVFNSATIRGGGKVMTARVNQVFEEGLPVVLNTSTPRPVVLLIVTDGLATDAQNLLNAVLGFCQKLDAKRVPPHMFRIHILQMGDDRTAVKPLHDFRDRITQRDRERHILNVVSYHRGRGLLNAQSIVKLLVASTHVPVEEDPDLRDRQPPEVIRAQYQAIDRIIEMGSR